MQQNYGFLTEKRRNFLTASPEERAQRYESNETSQYNLQIERHAKQAIIDLILVADGLPPKKTMKIFSIEVMQEVLAAVLRKHAREVTPEGVFFQVLIKKIVEEVNAQRDYPSEVRCDIIESPRGIERRDPPTYKRLIKDLSGAKIEVSDIDEMKIEEKIENQFIN